MKPFALLVAATGPAALVGMLGRVPVDTASVERLGWTLIHTVRQFALIALVAAVLQWSLRRGSARARYVAGVVLLGAPDGRFEFVGLPTDDFSINPAVKDDHASRENPNRNLAK